MGQLYAWNQQAFHIALPAGNHHNNYKAFEKLNSRYANRIICFRQ